MANTHHLEGWRCNIFLCCISFIQCYAKPSFVKKRLRVWRKILVIKIKHIPFAPDYYRYHTHHHHHHHHQDIHVPLSLSPSISLYYTSFLVSSLDDIQCPHINVTVFADQADASLSFLGVNKRMFPMSSSLFPQQRLVSWSSYLDGLWDKWWEPVHLLFCRVLIPGYIQNNMIHSYQVFT